MVTRPGRGTFVASQRPLRKRGDTDWQTLALGGRSTSAEGLDELLVLPPSGVIPLSTGYLPEELQPVSQLAAAMSRAARRPSAWARKPIEGLESLRAWFARAAGGGLHAHDTVITAGGQPALSACFRALCRPDTPILVDSPTYIGALAAARAAGLKIVPVPNDDRGVHPEQLADAIASSCAKVYYCQPTYANPHGAVLDAERRQAVRQIAQDTGIFVIEDDSNRDLSFGVPPPASLASDDPDGHIINVRSLTKAIAPGMRLCGISARGPVAARLKNARLVEDLFVAGPLQEATLEFLSSPAWNGHLRQVRSILKARCDGLVSAVREHLHGVEIAHLPSGGLHLWVRLPDDVSDAELAATATRDGVVVSPGRPWFPADPPGPYLRLTYAGAEASLLEQGVVRLATILARYRDQGARRGRR